MKLLIAVISCNSYEKEGLNNPMRETWLPDAVKMGMDYKFFHGISEPTNTNRFSRRPLRNRIEPRSDIVTVQVPDGYKDIALKTRASHAWAYANGYDYVFMCNPDTYACAERVRNCGFEKYDYFGHVDTFFCTVGSGLWLSRKAIGYTKDAPVDWRMGPVHGPNWCEESQAGDDVWIGTILMTHPDISRGFNGNLEFEGRKSPGPLKGNSVITSHLSDTEPYKHGGYKPEYMYEKHKAWIDSQ